MVMSKKVMLIATLVAVMGLHASEQPAQKGGWFSWASSWFTKKPVVTAKPSVNQTARQALEYQYKNNGMLKKTTIPKVTFKKETSSYYPYDYYEGAPENVWLYSRSYKYPEEISEKELMEYQSTVPDQVARPEFKYDELAEVESVKLGIEQKALVNALDDLKKTEKNINNINRSMEKALSSAYGLLSKCFSRDREWDNNCQYYPGLTKEIRGRFNNMREISEPLEEDVAKAKKFIKDRLSKIDKEAEDIKWRGMYSQYQLKEADKELQEGLKLKQEEDRAWRDWLLKQEIGE